MLKSAPTRSVNSSLKFLRFKVYFTYMKPINISSLIKKYGPGYIAKIKKTGKVIAHAKRLDVLFKKTGKRTDVVISWVPKNNAKYVFNISL
ncbi:MAG: hypothetical protein ACD_12C00262G0003 [uncultured bacterium]|nr:MAG: hypothetical protein ACD_12C00262G0003 [uncultured bacterium]